MKQIFDKDLREYVGNKITIDNGERTEDVELICVKENMISVKIKRTDDWDGIEPWYNRPVDYVKMFVHD